MEDDRVTLRARSIIGGPRSILESAPFSSRRDLVEKKEKGSEKGAEEVVESTAPAPTVKYSCLFEKRCNRKVKKG